MRKILILLLLAASVLFVGIVAYNVLRPRNDRQDLIAYAFPVMPLTAEGLVLPAWRKPIHVVVITDEVGGNPFSHALVSLLSDFSGSLVISEVDLASSTVGEGKDTLAICVCKDIISAAKNQLSVSWEYQTPNDVERAALLANYEKKGSKGFLSLRMSSRTREIDSATVYASSDAWPSSFAETAAYVATAISPQLQYSRRALALIENHLGIVRITEFGKLYLSTMLSQQVFPGMTRDAFEAVALGKP